MRQRMPIYLEGQLLSYTRKVKLTKNEEPLVLCQLVIPIYQIMP